MAAGTIEEIDIDLIDVSKWNIRKDLTAGTEDASIDDLAESIREKGLLHPITVRRTPTGRYELIAGQRRFLACRKLGMKRIPALIKEVGDFEALEISIVEGLHQAKVNPIDKARAFKQLMDHYGDIKVVAKKVGSSPATVRKYLSLLNLPEELQSKISTSEGPAKVEALSLLASTFQDKEDMLMAYEMISGFRQEVQKEILKRCEGDIGALPDLVRQAQEGLFNLHICRGLHECDFIPLELRGAVEEAVEAYKSGNLKEAMRRLRRA
jgi:ParB/RepB/Spo0J family partition protein